MDSVLEVERLSKRFTLHLQGGVTLEVLRDCDFAVQAGECVALTGPSGIGKSTVLKCIYGNYKISGGSIRIRSEGALVDVAQAGPRRMLALRRDTVGYVSQFLRVIPRISTIDVVAEPLLEGIDEANDDYRAQARDQAAALLARLNVPQRLWTLPPATFSGGEQQRVNIARTMIKPRPLLLLDEPTASLDADNTAMVVALVNATRERGCAIVGIFHDAAVRAALATRSVPFAMEAP